MENTTAQKIPEREQIIEALKTCFDPEIPVNIYDLGLVYRLDVLDSGIVEIDMTLTSPNCPAIEYLPEEVKDKVEEVPGVRHCKLELVWEPPFSQDAMSDEAKLALGLL